MRIIKKFISVLSGLLLTFVFVTSVSAAKPSGCTTIQSATLRDSAGNLIGLGYDQWGYNYEANMFNGWYDNYSRPTTPVEGGDHLIMKWNNAWLSNQDCDGDGKLDRHYGYSSYIGSGAWLTNHQYGQYDGNWNLVGDWVLDFDWNGGHYVHNMIIIDNTFSGTGAAQFSSQTWTVTGTISGDNVHMLINYNDSTYEVDVTGLIAPDGSMSGTWTSNSGQSGTWSSTSGTALKPVYYWDYFVKIVAAPSDATNDGGVWKTVDGAVIGNAIWGDFAIIQEIYNDTGTGESGVSYVGESPKGFGFYQP